MTSSDFATALGVALFVSAVSLPARAVDTVETWDVGTTDVDFYLGLDGVGHHPGDSVVYGDMMIGIGLVPRFSAYLGATLSANGYFTDGDASLYLGVFGTPLDTDHFDLDLFLNFCACGEALSTIGVTPAVELNFDADPEMGWWGLYLRAGEAIGGRANEDGGLAHTFATEVVFGGYYTINETLQMLVEVDFAVDHTAAASERELEVGGAALGLNFALLDEIELITQLVIDIPQDGEGIAASAMVGLIATLPSPVGFRLANPPEVSP